MNTACLGSEIARIEEAISLLNGLDLSDEEREEISRSYKDGAGVQHEYGTPTPNSRQGVDDVFEVKFEGHEFDAVIKDVKGFHVIFPAQNACLAIALMGLIGETLELMCESALSEEYFRENVAPWFVLRNIYSASHTVPGTMLGFEDSTVSHILQTLHGTCIVCISSDDDSMLQVLSLPNENCSRVFFVEYDSSHFFVPKGAVNGCPKMTRERRYSILCYVSEYCESLEFPQWLTTQIVYTIRVRVPITNPYLEPIDESGDADDDMFYDCE